MFKHFGKIFFVLFFGLLLLSVPNSGSASISLEFDPMNQSVNQGDIASVGVWVTDPGNIKVTDVDFWVNYDSNIIKFDSILWGNKLGPLVPDVDAGVNDIVAASFKNGSTQLVNVWVDATDTSAQDGSNFLLAILNFDTVGIGTSSLWLTDAAEADANSVNELGFVRNGFLYGGPVDGKQGWLQIDNNLDPGSITVASASVPEPGTALLLGLGLAALASLKKRTS